MSPVIAAQPEGAVIDTHVDTTEPSAALAEEINSQILSGLEDEQPIPPALLASLFLLLGVVVFIAVMMKRMSSRPEIMMQCSGHMKSHIYGYGSLNCTLDDLYEREYGKRGFLRSQEVSMKTRPTTFVSVSEIWKAQQSKNQRQIDKIVEEPEDDGSNLKIGVESEAKR